MFTGLIQQVGRLGGRERRAGGWRLSVACGPWDEPLAVGESVAVQGVCLTVTAASARAFEADLLDETLARSALGALRTGAGLNLERALRPADRLGGHIVAGHVDETGRIARIVPAGRDRRIRVACSPEATRQMALKGSVALDGISLTISGLGDDWFEVHIIPHTWNATSLAERAVGDAVNVETDVLAKYVQRLLGAVRPGVTMESLARAGFA
jgi:riboflavin synthase